VCQELPLMLIPARSTLERVLDTQNSEIAL
jgi:hypothetical protein